MSYIYQTVKHPKNTIYLISNMYPSKSKLRYGVFIKNFKNAVNKDFNVKKIVLPYKNTFWEKFCGYVNLYFKILLLQFKIKPKDLVYVHAPLFVAPALFPFCFRKQKIILNFHGSDLRIDNLKKRILSFFQNCLIKKYPVVVPSSYYAEIIKKNYKKKNHEILIYPSGGIDLDIFKPGITSTKKKTFVLSFVSNFIASKGWKIFLDSITKLQENKDIDNLQVIMVGDGPDKAAIKRIVKERKLPVSLRSNLSHTEISEVYKQSDVFIFPTETESLGLVGLEAMACGTPVIARKIPAIETYLTDKKNGLFFNGNSASALYHTIIKYYTLPDQEKTNLQKQSLETAIKYDKNIVKIDLLQFLKNQAG